MLTHTNCNRNAVEPTTQLHHSFPETRAVAEGNRVLRHPERHGVTADKVYLRAAAARIRHHLLVVPHGRASHFPALVGKLDTRCPLHARPVSGSWSVTTS